MQYVTFVLAVWGSVIATILFAIKVAEVRRDRAALWIRACFGSTDGVSRGFSFRIVNRGRRVAYVREVRVRMRYRTDITIEGRKGPSIGNDTFWLHDVFSGDPIKLDEGEQKHFSEWVTLADRRCYLGGIAEVVTTSGNRYRSRVFDLFQRDDLGPDEFV